MGVPLHYETLERLQAVHKSGYAVRHDRHPLIADQVDPQDRYDYTWHSQKRVAYRELRQSGVAGSSCVIPIEETEIYRRVHMVLRKLKQGRRRSRSRRSGGNRADPSSTSAVS